MLDHVPPNLRILNLIQDLAHGGAQRQLVYLSRGLVGRGHEVHAAFLDGGPNFADLASCGAVLYHLGSGDVHRARGRGLHNYDARIMLSLVRLIREVRPDLAQTWIIQMDILGGIACQLTRAPWVIREPNCGSAYERSFKAAIRARVAGSADAVVANSLGGQEYWRSRAPRLPSFVVPNGVPLDQTDATASPEVEMLADKRHVLYAGRFAPEKNVETLARASLELWKRDPDVMVTLCGDGPERARVAELVQRNGAASRVRLPGAVANTRALMKRADVFVSVSRFEGHPNTVLEAMACGCPVVVSDIASHREFLDEGSALFVSADDVSGICEAILATLAQPEEARRRARSARAVVERYSIAAMTESYERVYREVLGSRA
jgi:glycosyltransferase involved in cell wall biosynthesis